MEIVYCDDDHIYLAGALMTATQFGDILLDGPSWGFDFFVTRMNAAGEFLWATEVPSQQFIGDATVGSVMFMAADDDKNIYLSGFQRGVIDWGGGFTTVGNNLGYDILTLKYSPAGEMLNAKVAGGGLYDWANSVTTGTGGSWYLAGTIWDGAAFDTININVQGVRPFIAKIDFESTSTRIARSDGLPAISVYPNPVTRFLYISHADQINKIDRFMIYNEMGELTILQTDNQLSCVDMSSLRNGLYFVNILFHDGSTSAIKIVKR
ncbi:MAG: T9SS type A sorting domain-containing protein [Bacteroidales bacterium]